MPFLAGVELIAENVGRFVRLGLKGLIVGVHSIVGVAIDDPHKGSCAWELRRQHHIEVNLASLALDFDFQNASKFDVSFGISSLS